MASLRSKSKPEQEEVEVLVPDEKTEVPEVEIKEVQVQTEPKTNAQPNVRVNPNTDIRTYIGDSWYSLKKGKQETVPQTVKDILQRAGLLDPL